MSPALAHGDTRNARKTLVALAALVLFSGTAFGRDTPISFGLVKGSPGSDLSGGAVVPPSEAKGEWKGGGTFVLSGGVRF